MHVRDAAARSRLVNVNTGDADVLPRLASRRRNDRRTIEANRRFSTAMTRAAAGAELEGWPRDFQGACEAFCSYIRPFAQGRRLPMGSMVIGPQTAARVAHAIRRETGSSISVRMARCDRS